MAFRRGRNTGLSLPQATRIRGQESRGARRRIPRLQPTTKPDLEKSDKQRHGGEFRGFWAAPALGTREINSGRRRQSSRQAARENRERNAARLQKGSSYESGGGRNIRASGSGALQLHQLKKDHGQPAPTTERQPLYAFYALRPGERPHSGTGVERS
ncbi:hypothetical protein KP509_24G023400 [Ceratopteris richardii]|uniref:Uncharacterized protein n=1 Tax=Ceratopteris richardii TaxID=49495 RepID=A0A8T2RVV0_CERRI|nr:hypothetical protein KP509_24G023400 [Ceratopteris richardii]